MFAHLLPVPLPSFFVAPLAADFYGVRQTYTVLAHLRWAIKQENAAVTAECLEILGSELKPLKEAEANDGLLPQVLLSSRPVTLFMRP